jgi:hypothetical protein
VPRPACQDLKATRRTANDGRASRDLPWQEYGPPVWQRNLVEALARVIVTWRTRAEPNGSVTRP